MSNHAVFILSAYLAGLVILGGLTIASLSARNKVRRELAARGLRKKTMTPKRKRLWLLVGSLGVLGVAAALVLTALERQSRLLLFADPGGGEARRRPIVTFAWAAWSRPAA